MTRPHIPRFVPRLFMILLAWLFATAEHGSGASLSHTGILSVADPAGALPTIRFSLPQSGNLQVSVWNTLGQRVSAFSASYLLAGVYALSWDGLDAQGRTVGAGVYFIRIVAHGRSYSYKTVVFRGVTGRTHITYAGAASEPASVAPFQDPVSGPLRSYAGQWLTAEDWNALASPLTYDPGVRHRAFGRALAQLRGGTLSRRELERGVGGPVVWKNGAARPRRALAKPILLEQNGTVYQVHEAQYLPRFRGINLLGDGEQDGDVDSDDLFRAADALENQEPYYDLNRNGGVDLWDLFAVVDHMGLRREGPFLLLNEGGFRLCEAGVSESSAGDFPHIEYFNPAAPSVSAALESLICGNSNQPLEAQRSGIEPFVVVRSALPNHMRFISPLNFWSGVSDTAGAQGSTRIVQEVFREDRDGTLLDGLHYVAFGYRLPQVDENGNLVSQVYEYSQVLVFGWHFSEAFDGLPKLNTFPVDPNLDVGYEPPGPAAISHLTATAADQPGRFLVAVNANRLSFGLTFFVSQTSLELEELSEKGIPVSILGESGSGFAREYEVEVPVGEWLLYGGLLVDGADLAGLAVSQISSAGPADTQVEISFEDAGLEAAVRSAIARPEGALFPADVTTVNELVASSLRIGDLAGIEHLTALQRLDLRSNELVDLAPLGALAQLRELHLGNNRISDLAPLARLVELNAVGLEDNRIEELAALVENSGLRRGDTIDLRGNPLTENAILNALCVLERRRVSVLSSALSCVDIENLEAAGLEKPLLFADINLERAIREAIGKIQGNLFSSDVKGLLDLNATGRGIVDLGGIEQVTDLQAIDLGSNRIAELDPLSGLPNLTSIRLNDNEVTDVYSGLVVVEAEWKPEELPLAVAVKTHTSTTGGKNMHPLHYRQKRELVAGRVVLGIDPGKKRHTAWMLDTDGLPRGRAFSFSVDHHGFEEVLWQEVATRLAEYGPEQLVIAVETACNLWKTIASYAHQQGYTVILVSPLTTHHARPLCDHDFSRTDPKDAFLVADQARQGRFDLFQVFDAEIEAMRQLSLAYHKLAKDKQRQRQRLRAFMEQYFPEYLNAFDIESQTSLYLLERYFLPQHFQTLDVEAEARVIAPMSRQQHGVETLLWLQEWANESIGVAAASQEESLRLVLDGWLVQLRVLQAQIKKLRKALIERAARHRAFAILTSIPNISEWLAALFIAECRGLDATTHYKQIDKFAGLKLKVVNSGEFVGQRRISYIGNKRLRKVIYQMTQQTAKAVPQVRCRFLRRQLNQACYRKNIVAASAPLLKLIHALVKQQRPYRPHAKWNKQLMELEKAYTQKKTKQRTRRPPETRRQAA